MDIVKLIRNDIYCANRNRYVPEHLQVLVVFRFYATGTFQTVVSNLAGVYQSSVSWIVSRVTAALARLKQMNTHLSLLEMNYNVFKKDSMRWQIFLVW